MKALILDSGNSASYHAMRSLAGHGVEVHLVAGRYCHWLTSKHCARGILWPPGESAGWGYDEISAFLMEILRDDDYRLVLSCGDTHTEAIYAHHGELSERVDCVMPDPRIGEIVLSKSRASEFAKSLGVPVPDTFPVDDSNPAVMQLPYPVVVKGQTGSGSASVRFSLGAEEFKRHYREILAMESATGALPSVQEYVGGNGYLVHLLYWHGKPYAAVCHRKDREFPVGGGVTAAATTVDEPALLNAAMRIADALEWHGLVKMDFVRDPVTSEFKFVEIDPRVSASVDISRVAGVDQVATLARLVSGDAVEPDLRFKADMRYRWLFPRDLLASVTQPGAYLRLLTDLFSPNVHFDFSFADSRPLYYQLGRFISERQYLDPELRRKADQARAVMAAYERRRNAPGTELHAP